MLKKKSFVDVILDNYLIFFNNRFLIFFKHTGKQVVLELIVIDITGYLTLLL